MTHTQEYLQRVLNALYNGPTTGPLTGAIAEQVIKATEAIRSAIVIEELAELDCYFEELDKQALTILVRYNAMGSPIFRVANYYMYKAAIEQSSERYIAGQFGTRADAERFIQDIASGEEQLDEVLTYLEAQHP